MIARLIEARSVAALWLAILAIVLLAMGLVLLFLVIPNRSTVPTSMEDLCSAIGIKPDAETNDAINALEPDTDNDSGLSELCANDNQDDVVVLFTEMGWTD